MKGLIVTEKHELRLVQNIPMPELGDYDALVKNHCCIICNGTDLEIVNGRLAEISEYPTMLGHESAGYVIKCGEKVKNYGVGDLVVRTIVRKNAKYSSAWGGFSEYGIVTDYNAMVCDGFPEADNYTIGLMQRVFPNTITPLQAAMSITFKETYSAFSRLSVQEGSTLVLVGDGPVALCMTNIAKLFGVKEVFLIGENEKTMKMALSLGATAAYNHLDGQEMMQLNAKCHKRVNYYIDTIGTNETIAQGLGFLDKDGMIVVYGLHSGAELRVPLMGMRNFAIRFMQFPIHIKEGEAHGNMVRAIMDGKIDIDALVTNIMPIEDFSKAFALIQSKQAVKVALLL